MALASPPPMPPGARWPIPPHDSTRGLPPLPAAVPFCREEGEAPLPRGRVACARMGSHVGDHESEDGWWWSREGSDGG